MYFSNHYYQRKEKWRLRVIRVFLWVKMCDSTRPYQDFYSPPIIMAHDEKLNESSYPGELPQANFRFRRMTNIKRDSKRVEAATSGSWSSPFMDRRQEPSLMLCLSFYGDMNVRSSVWSWSTIHTCDGFLIAQIMLPTCCIHVWSFAKSKAARKKLSHSMEGTLSLLKLTSRQSSVITLKVIAVLAM
jgi:hypothetical protein